VRRTSVRAVPSLLFHHPGPRSSSSLFHCGTPVTMIGTLLEADEFPPDRPVHVPERLYRPGLSAVRFLKALTHRQDLIAPSRPSCRACVILLPACYAPPQKSVPPPQQEPLPLPKARPPPAATLSPFRNEPAWLQLVSPPRTSKVVAGLLKRSPRINFVLTAFWYFFSAPSTRLGVTRTEPGFRFPLPYTFAHAFHPV